MSKRKVRALKWNLKKVRESVLHFNQKKKNVRFKKKNNNKSWKFMDNPPKAKAAEKQHCNSSIYILETILPTYTNSLSRIPWNVMWIFSMRWPDGAFVEHPCCKARTVAASSHSTKQSKSQSLLRSLSLVSVLRENSPIGYELVGL